MTLFRIIKDTTTVKWIKAKCPICGKSYDYPAKGYKPKTCGKFECVHKHLHPELTRGS
jgi:hypothetical protein